jgi:hypothetical protein
MSMVLLIISSCKKDEVNNGNAWLIPSNEVRDGGPGKDGIPALTNPNLISAQQAGYLNDNDLVMGYIDGDDARAYPHKILDWHEIINDDTDNESFAVIYCPLTGTGVAWDRKLEGQTTTYGVSGLLYNSNVIPYDRLTNTNWSQLLLMAVNGELAATQSVNHHLVETTWATWQQMYPETKVVSTNTGHNRSYGNYPYGNYRTNESLLFPVSNNDSRLPRKTRVLGIIKNEKAKAYRFTTFPGEPSLITDVFEGEEIVVIGSSTRNFIVAFSRQLADGSMLEVQAVQNQLPAVMEGSDGTRWDVFGRAISGPRAGEQLTALDQMMGYWFSFPAFYQGVDIYGE